MTPETDLFRGGESRAAGASDSQLVNIWLHGRSPQTQRAYALVCGSFPGRGSEAADAALTLADLQALADGLGELAPACCCRVLSAVKSLLAFGQRIGYQPFDTTADATLFDTSKDA